MPRMMNLDRAAAVGPDEDVIGVYVAVDRSGGVQLLRHHHPPGAASWNRARRPRRRGLLGVWVRRAPRRERPSSSPISVRIRIRREASTRRALRATCRLPRQPRG
ncbi:hypothetical protein SEVIR_4G155450v4 [Setaria viridis]